MVATTIVVYTLVDAKGARLSESAISYGIYMFAIEGITFNIAMYSFSKIRKFLFSLSQKKNIKYY